LLIFVGVYLFLFFRKTNKPVSKDRINFATVFDENSPIPYQQDGLYGYINSNTGEILIRAKFAEAERFYGDYAKIKTTDGKYQIIDKDVNVMASSDSDNISYELYGDLWAAADNLYDAKMTKLNADGTKAGYLGNGYMIVYPEGEMARLQDLKGKEYYKCESSWCSFLIINVGSEDYAIVKDEGNKIININNGSTLYESSKDDYSLSSTNGGSVIVERPKTGEGEVSYLTIQNGKVNKTSERPEISSEKMEYDIEECSNGFYQVKKSDGSAISDCKYEGKLDIPEIVELKLEAEGVFPLLLKEEEKVVLYDAKGNKVIRSFNGDRVEISDESPFVIVYSADATKVCNLLTDSSCPTIKRNFTASLFSNYLVVDGVLYNYNLEKKR